MSWQFTTTHHTKTRNNVYDLHVIIMDPKIPIM